MYYKVKRLNPESPDLDIDLKPCRRAPMTAAQESAYDAHLRRQLTELLTNYGKVDVLWFNGKPSPMTPAEIRKLQPSILINGRAFGSGDFNTHAAERELPATRPAKDWWENCQVWAKSNWAYVKEIGSRTRRSSNSSSSCARGTGISFSTWGLWLPAICRTSLTTA